MARGAPATDCARIEGLRFEVDVGIWRADSTLIAGRVVDDAGYATDADGE